MSQAGIINISGGGGSGSPIQTVSTDVDGPAIPVANNINLFGRDTTDNNDNGIQTINDPDGSETVYVELTNRIQGEVTTPDATPDAIWTFNLDTGDNNAYTFDSTVTAIAIENVPPNTARAAGFKVFGTVVVDGLTGTATVVGSTTNVAQRDTFMNGTTVEYQITGGNAVSLMATGLAQNVFWKAVTYYTTIQD